MIHMVQRLWVKGSTPSSGSFHVKITVADALLKELERIGVDTVFGIISIHNIPFYDAIERHGGFRVVAGRHEGAVVNMADAYSRVSGKLGVALTSTGTGAGNAADPPRVPSDAELLPAVERMLEAKRPVIWAGSGAMFSDSSPEVTELMQFLNAAVITTQSARGIVPETVSICIGHFATFPALQDFVAKADLLISIGVRFRGNETSNWSLTPPAEQ